MYVFYYICMCFNLYACQFLYIIKRVELQILTHVA